MSHADPPRRAPTPAGPPVILRMVALTTLLAGVAAAWRSGPGTVLPRVDVMSVRAVRECRAEPNSVSGTVLRDGGIGVGVAVSLTGPDGRPVAATTTDAWGRFAFDGVQPGVPHTLALESEAHAPLRIPGIVLRPLQRREFLDIYVSRPQTRELVVTDELAAPVAGAVVELYRHPSAAHESWIERAPDFVPVPIFRGTTDERGRLVLDGSSGGRDVVVARAPGLARTTRILRWEGGGTVPLTLLPACRLDGTLRDSRGDVVVGAIVRARRPQRRIDARHGRHEWAAAQWGRTTTDSDGRWRFDDLPPGPVEIDVARPGTGTLVGVAVRVPASGPVDLVAADTVRISGTVLDSVTGAPVGGVPVMTQDVWDDDPDPVVFSDAQGRWTIDLAADDVQHRSPKLARTPGIARGTERWSPERRRLSESAPGATPDLEVCVQMSTASLAMTVLRSAERPEDWFVYPAIGVGARGAPRPLYDECAVRSADARFRFDDLPPGAASVAAARLGFRMSDLCGDWTEQDLRGATVPLVAGAVTDVRVPIVRTPASDDPLDDAPLRYAVRSELRVRVRVRTADGLPLRFAFVRVGDAADPRGTDDGVPIASDGTATMVLTSSVGVEASELKLVAWDDRHLPARVVVALPPSAAEAQDASAEIVLPAAR